MEGILPTRVKARSHKLPFRVDITSANFILLPMDLPLQDRHVFQPIIFLHGNSALC